MNEIKRQAFDSLLKGFSDFIGFDELASTLHAFTRFNVPRFLYRYRPCGREHSFTDIEGGVITFAPACSFPDKDDSAIHDMGMLQTMSDVIVNNSDRTLEMLQKMKGAMKNQENEGIWNQVMKSAEELYSWDSDERVKRMGAAHEWIENACDISDFNEQFRSHQKIVCLCDNGKSSHMWKEYAVKGTGYLIEYDSSDLLNIGNEYGQAPLILPVVYAKDLPDTYILPFILSLPIDIEKALGADVVRGGIANNQIKSIFYKRQKYQQEEEWRMMITDIEGEKAGDYIERKVRPTRLIAGKNMSPADRERLFDCARQNSIPVNEQGSPPYDRIKE